MKGNVAENFEELFIYQRARELTNAVYAVSRTGAFQKDFGLVDQIRRAAVSVMSNIAEGFERGSKLEFLQFLFIAKGSCGEVRAQMQIAADQNYISVEVHTRLNDLCRRTSGMISNFIAHIQGSQYQGEKFSRPERLGANKSQDRQAALRAAQLVNMKAAENKSPPNEQ